MGLRTSLSEVQTGFSASTAAGRLGFSLACAGDVNGDGLADFLVGAPWENANGAASGKAYLLLGRRLGWEGLSGPAGADASFLGENPGDNAGWCVSGAGDVNDDGLDDILIAAPYFDSDETNQGQTYLILGRISGWRHDTPLSEADASFLGESRFDIAGLSVAGAGDVNFDGFADFLIGAPSSDEPLVDCGQTYLLLGRPALWAMQTSLAEADASFVGESAGDFSGQCVERAGDTNGDGIMDFLIAAPFWEQSFKSNVGKTTLLFGRKDGWGLHTPLAQGDASFIGEGWGDRSGSSLAGVGDTNADGYDDFLIGAHFNNASGADAGQVYLVYGKAEGFELETSLSFAEASFLGEEPGDHAGWALSAAGDTNGDGFADFAVSAYGSDHGGFQTGEVYLLLGRPGGWAPHTSLAQASASFLGENVGDYAGQCIAGGGDANGDRYGDLLVGAYGYDPGDVWDAGRAYVLLLNARKSPACSPFWLLYD